MISTASLKEQIDALRERGRIVKKLVLTGEHINDIVAELKPSFFVYRAEPDVQITSGTLFGLKFEIGSTSFIYFDEVDFTHVQELPDENTLPPAEEPPQP